MYRHKGDVHLTEEELCAAILHYLRAEGGSEFSDGMGDKVKVRAAPVETKEGRHDFVVAAA